MSSKILVVDDEREACELLKRFLSSRQYEVEIAANGNEAKRSIQMKMPDCILADIKMPVMGGDELLVWMRNNQISIPVIVMTGVTDVQKAQECCDLGAAHYLVKPLDLEEVAVDG